MKKFLTIVFAICLSFGCLTGIAGCKEDPDTITVYMPDGATALSLSYMMKNYNELDGKKIKYNVVSPNLIATYVRNGEADMAVLPTNAAAMLYGLGFEYKYAAALTHGNLFLIGAEVESLEDLRGNVVGCIGKGQIPDLLFQYFLKRYDLEFEESETPIPNKVAIRYFDSGTQMRNIMAAQQNNLLYGVMAAPDVTNAIESLNSAAGIEYTTLDLQHEWMYWTEFDKGWPELIGDPVEGYAQAGLFVKNSLDAQFVSDFLTKCKQGDNWAQQKPQEALEAINNNMPDGSSITFVSGKGVEQVSMCNIKIKSDGLKKYVESLFSAIGIGLPDDGFYWKAA